MVFLLFSRLVRRMIYCAGDIFLFCYKYYIITIFIYWCLENLYLFITTFDRRIRKQIGQWDSLQVKTRVVIIMEYLKLAKNQCKSYIGYGFCCVFLSISFDRSNFFLFSPTHTTRQKWDEDDGRSKYTSFIIILINWSSHDPSINYFLCMDCKNIPRGDHKLKNGPLGQTCRRGKQKYK